ncbi:MAG: DnaA regulatory inactivator Hda [Gammaproteobacteria bacterium]|nr:DnaA regulatory inactivator Hda [Gammaproteobacteria bacterium]
MSQLALPLQLADHAVFASFLESRNETLVAALKRLAAGDGDHGCWIFGPRSSGKTHLLQAVCEQAGDRAVYMPMTMLADAGVEMLDGLASRELICIDDIERVLGDPGWEAALFALANELADDGGQLVVGAAAPPRESAIQLADLQSRLSRLPVFQLKPLSDSDCISALQLRSRHRGLDLPDDTAQYLLKRSRRDMASLYELLDQLDREALRAKRRLTIPFVREVLGANTSPEVS